MQRHKNRKTNPYKEANEAFLQVKALGAGVRPAIREIGEGMGLQVVDLMDVFQGGSYCFDGVHPQREGTRMMAEKIYQEVFAVSCTYTFGPMGATNVTIR